jgi:hypothetical protein
MGAGIGAAISLVITPRRHNGFDERCFTPGFFDCYNKMEEDSNAFYVMKEDFLINNYKSFLIEFYDCIGADIYKETGLLPDTIPIASNIVEFTEAFDRHKRDQLPKIYDAPFFSTLGCECVKFWYFYSGSYKAFLEEYSTLQHFENVLAKAMSNPLSNAVKFGIFG